MQPWDRHTGGVSKKRLVATTEDLADLFGTSVDVVRHWISGGQLPLNGDFSHDFEVIARKLGWNPPIS